MSSQSHAREDTVRTAQAAAGEVLERPFRIIAFDWDGTAVRNRWEDATPVREVIEHLLKLGVYIVVITGTNFQNIDRQLSAAIRGDHKRFLFACTNRGSEVFGFDEHSRPIPLRHRIATPEEDRLLNEVAEAVRDHVQQRTGLEVGIVYDRLNRRKIDLIPLPEWSDPPKAMIGQLLMEVERRLIGGGIAGGLREVFAYTQEVARRKGLPEARITSDVKHIEVGLTDKADSIAWVMRDLAAKAGIAATDVLLGGDEFGPIAGFEGSDFRMVTPDLKGATIVSVGAEPNGVPPGVVHLGGGPARFLVLLEEQVHHHLQRRAVGLPELWPAVAPPFFPETPAERVWSLIEEGFTPEREHEVESLFTVANGYAGTRGSLEEGVALSRPATFIAGVFNHPPDGVPELAIAPEWSKIRVYVDGWQLRLDQGEMLDHWRQLDMRRGILEREWRHRDSAGRTTHLKYRRFVSLADRRAFVESLSLMPENYSGRIRVESVLAAHVGNPSGVDHVEVSADEGEVMRSVATAAGAPLVLTARTIGSGVRLAFATAHVFTAPEATDLGRAVVSDDKMVGEGLEWQAEIGLTYRIDKLTAAATSRDEAEPRQAAVEHLTHLLALGVDALTEQHVQAWAKRWEVADVRLPGKETDQRAARFSIYHLTSSVNPADEWVSVGARGLTGQSYKGHVFWDTDIYMVPFYVFTDPPAARALLMYRYHMLPGARKKAREKGYRGALYPWESADSGDEVTPSFGLGPGGQVIPILTGDLEQHISADVAYAVWQYWRATGDDDFLLRAGAEILLETARFWASRATKEADGRYHIRNVIGPDEYHERVDDNAYTNVMAQCNIEWALQVAELLRERWPERWSDLSDQLALTAGEMDAWRETAQAMYTGFDPATGLFEQFQGYFSLEDIDVRAYEPRTAPMEVILGRERTARSQIIKQSDVVILMYLLWDRFPPAVREANFRYYEPRCGHGSSLSPSIHALVAARLGFEGLARRYFRQAFEIDLINNMGNAAGGVHSAAQGGLWQAIVFGFGGMQLREDGLAFDPRPLPEWRTLEFCVQWRGRKLHVSAEAAPRSVAVRLLEGEPMVVALGEGDAVKTIVQPSKRYRASRIENVWQPWQELKQ